MAKRVRENTQPGTVNHHKKPKLSQIHQLLAYFDTRPGNGGGLILYIVSDDGTTHGANNIEYWQRISVSIAQCSAAAVKIIERFPSEFIRENR